MVVCWITRLLFLMDWMEVTNVVTRPAGAAVKPNKSVPHIIYRFAQPHQAAMYLPNGQAIVEQIFREKATHNATYVDMEKLANAMSFFLELAEWGPKGPPGGFSIKRLGRSFRRIRSVNSRRRQSRHIFRQRRRNVKKLPNYKTVHGHLYFIPKPNTEAEKTFLKGAAKLIEKVKNEMEAQTTENPTT